MTSARGRTMRRNNAPIRPPKPATSVPDVIFTLAAAGLTMAVIFFVASFTNGNITEGEAGQVLARLFAGALALTAGFGFLLGILLLRGERRRRDHYVVPALLGAVIGVLEAVLFLIPAAGLLWVPFVLLVFAFRPVRRQVARLLRRQPGYAR